jgi:hypothetical protein
MPSDLFTHLLIERLKWLTSPSKSREEADEDSQAFETIIAQASPLEVVTLEEMREELDYIRSRSKELEKIQDRPKSDEQPVQPQESPLFGALLSLHRRIDQIESKLRETINIKHNIDYLDERLSRLDQEEIRSVHPVNPEEVVIKEYFQMDKDDFNILTPEIHIWFLERILTNPKDTTKYDISRITDVYLDIHVGLLRYLVVHVLCQLESDDFFNLRAIGKGIYAQYKTEHERLILYQQLVDILVDISTEAALNGLRILIQEERQRDIPNLIAKHVQERARQMGNQGTHLLGLIDTP